MRYEPLHHLYGPEACFIIFPGSIFHNESLLLGLPLKRTDKSAAIQAGKGYSDL